MPLSGACLLLTAILASLTVACAKSAAAPEKQTVASTLVSARTPAGEFISWKEHIIDDAETGGVAIAGGDGLVMADLDLDGRLDIVSVHESDTAYDGVGDGHIRLAFASSSPDRWHLATLAQGPEAGAAEDAAIADVNGDGYPDIVAACELAHLIYFQNPGKNARTEAWKRLIPPVANNRGSFIRVFFADFNGDGRPEVVAPNKGTQAGRPDTPTSKPISWFEIKGDPLKPASWIEHPLINVRVPINSRPVDLDGDGDLDILGGSRGERRIFWFENQSETKGARRIRFVEHSIEIAAEAGRKPSVTGFNFDFADFNGDGRLDVVLADGRNNWVWIAQPDDPSKAWQLHLIGTVAPDSATGLALADINGDGRLDLITGGYSGAPRDRDGDVPPTASLGRLAWFEQPADASKPWIRHDISRRKRGMFDKFVPRDMDGDGDIDFVSTRGNSVPWDGVFWLEQVRSRQPVPAFRPARAKDSAEMPLP